MKRSQVFRSVLAILALGLLSSPLSAQKSRQRRAHRAESRTLSAREVAQKAFTATVEIITENDKGQADTLGSGFFVQGYLIATNHHVIKGASAIYARIVGQKQFFKISKIDRVDEENDLALLRVEGFSIKPLPLGNSSAIKVGDEIYAVGNPEGFEGTFSQGIVSALRRNKLIQITAPISHGSSGGPILNNRGEVIGIAVLTIKDGQNLNFAVPIACLIALINNPLSVLHSEKILDPTTNQNYSRQITGEKDERDKKLTQAYLDYFNTNRLKDAIEYFKAAIAQDVASYQAHYLLGLAYHYVGRYNEAVSEMNVCIHLKPDHLAAYDNLVSCYSELGLHQRAIDLAKDLIRRVPEFDIYYCKLASAYDKAGRTYEAIETYKQAISLNPDNPVAHHSLGLIYNQIGNKKAALDEYQVVKSLNPKMAEIMFKYIYK